MSVHWSADPAEQCRSAVGVWNVQAQRLQQLPNGAAALYTPCYTVKLEYTTAVSVEHT